MDYMEQAVALWKRDRFARGNGIELIEVGKLYAKCRMTIEEKHLNCVDGVMGGAIFTLADFTFGSAANLPVENCTTLDSSFNFLRATSAPVLYAEAKCIKDGRKICLFSVSVTDDEGKLIAEGQFKGFRLEL